MKALITIVLIVLGIIGTVTGSIVIWSVLGIALIIIVSWTLSTSKAPERRHDYSHRDRESRNAKLAEEARRQRLIRKTH